MHNVVLASPLNDSEGLLFSSLKNNGDKLKKIYSSKLAISVTKNSSKRIKYLLKEFKFNIHFAKGKSIGDHYREAIRFGLSLNTEYIHLLDFDRALHWVEKYPREMKEIVGRITQYPGYLSFNRSRSSFKTHPVSQRSTERTVNEIASRIAGAQIDIMSGSISMDRNLAEIVVKESKRKDFGFYAEPLMIAKKHYFKISSIKVANGLEWETPDRYKNTIRKTGYYKWSNEFQSLEEWKKRISILNDSTKTLLYD